MKNSSVVTKAVYPETEAPGFEAKAKAVAFETEAVDHKTEAKPARQYVNKMSHVSSKFSTQSPVHTERIDACQIKLMLKIMKRLHQIYSEASKSNLFDFRQC